MFIGIPKEIKNNENRVGITPAGVVCFVQAGHSVMVERGAGLGSGFEDADYEQAGAQLVDTDQVWQQADMILKVKEPLPQEYGYLREGLVLFTYLHLAADPVLTQELVNKKVFSIGYETVEVEGQLPLLVPMSEVAGRMAVQIGANLLEKTQGGKGVLLSAVPGVQRGKVTIIGGGVVGTNAAKIAVGLGANVTIIDRTARRLRELDDMFGCKVNTLISNSYNIAKAVKESDLVIGAVLLTGAKAPKLITEEMVKTMDKGSVIIDVAIDQGGIVETADTVSTHEAPTYERHGVIHYAVANMPGAVARTSTIALTNETLPFALQLANLGAVKAVASNAGLAEGVNTLNGFITYRAVAHDLGKLEHFKPLTVVLHDMQ